MPLSAIGKQIGGGRGGRLSTYALPFGGGNDFSDDSGSWVSLSTFMTNAKVYGLITTAMPMNIGMSGTFTLTSTNSPIITVNLGP